MAETLQHTVDVARVGQVLEACQTTAALVVFVRLLRVGVLPELPLLLARDLADALRVMEAVVASPALVAAVCGHIARATDGLLHLFEVFATEGAGRGLIDTGHIFLLHLRHTLLRSALEQLCRNGQIGG